jgi:hypothetical protein
MNNRLINNLINKSQLIQEKNRGVKNIDIDFPVFVTLYTPLKEELDQKYKDLDIHKASIKRLKNYLKNKEYKGEYYKLSELFPEEYDEELRRIKILATQSEAIDIDWINAQNEYISKLPKRDILTAIGYTYTGDVVLNSYLKGTFDIVKYQEELNKEVRLKYSSRHKIWLKRIYPFFTQIVDVVYKDSDYGYESYLECLGLIQTLPVEKWYEVFEMYKLDMQRIIAGAPTNKKQIVVWRGVKEKRLHDYKESSNDVYNLVDQFSSTTLNLNVARDFTGYRDDNGIICCLLQINILPGIHSLFMLGLSYLKEEYEILLNINSKYLIKENKVINTSNSRPTLTAITKVVVVK